MRFKIASSPHTHNHRQTNRMMLLVIFACIPGLIAQWYFFGYGNLVQIALASTTALCAESAILTLRKKPIISCLKDNSALLTAILLGTSLPPLASWWLVIIGTLFAIVIAKQLYGGLGQNPFNPAMVGYVVLLISFPVPMTQWIAPFSQQSSSFIDTASTILGSTSWLNTIDGISQATPLDGVRTALHNGQIVSEILHMPSFSQFGGEAWLWINIAFLFGGLFLILQRIISWHIPLSFLAGLSLSALAGLWLEPTHSAPLWLHLFSGATMLGAFFIATDPVTASTTYKGRLIFGALIGALVWIIRSYGGYPDAVAFAVLLANIATPLIDHYTQPRAYGH